MGKMPLAGLIGACSIGMLLTGCNCCNKQNSRPSYMGGKADAPTDFTRSKPKGNSLAPDLNAGSVPLDSTSSSGAGLTSGLAPASQGMSNSSNVGGTMMPNNTAGTPMSGNYPALPSSNNPAMPPLGANTPSMGSSASLTNNGGGALAASSYSGNGAAPAPIQQVGNRGDDSSTVKDAGFSGFSDTSSPMSSSGMGRAAIPPPPNVNPYPPTPPSSPMSGGNSPSSMSSALPPPPPPPPSDNSNLLMAPPPNVNSGSSSAMSGLAAPTSASSGRPSPLPSYLDSK